MFSSSGDILAGMNAVIRIIDIGITHWDSTAVCWAFQVRQENLFKVR